MKQNPARIDHPKTASGPESSFSLTRQAQTNHYDRRIGQFDRRILILQVKSQSRAVAGAQGRRGPIGSRTFHTHGSNVSSVERGDG
jgi:hypothetical protein